MVEEIVRSLPYERLWGRTIQSRESAGLNCVRMIEVPGSGRGLELGCGIECCPLIRIDVPNISAIVLEWR